MVVDDVCFLIVDPGVLSSLEEKDSQISGVINVCQHVLTEIGQREVRMVVDGITQEPLKAEKLESHKPYTPKRFVFTPAFKTLSQKNPRQVLFCIQIFMIHASTDSHVTFSYSRLTEANGAIKGNRLQFENHTRTPHANAGKKLGLFKPLPPKRVVKIIDVRTKKSVSHNHAPAPPETQVESKISPEMSDEQKEVELKKFVDFFSATRFDHQFSAKISECFLSESWTLEDVLAIIKTGR